jgi:hypothetical protein
VSYPKAVDSNRQNAVDTENSVRIENAGFHSVREIIMVSTMTPFFIAVVRKNKNRR